MKEERQCPDGMRTTLTRGEYKALIEVQYGVAIASQVFEHDKNYWADDSAELPWGPEIERQRNGER